jgi:hypothetical protein
MLPVVAILHFRFFQLRKKRERDGEIPFPCGEVVQQFEVAKMCLNLVYFDK